MYLTEFILQIKNVIWIMETEDDIISCWKLDIKFYSKLITMIRIKAVYVPGWPWSSVLSIDLVEIEENDWNKDKKEENDTDEKERER